ncbi:hypothetical protein ACRE_019690 [Hapsidospora chrysogenum ATCC 11550]|uniref:Uncharacterized protein n=1 Tax=Hapsidospora chrysogenum (strain ATCC 11550 / CBS 779.69 / DSM 880 / IAM 14645 / JCM 23072 / IMI 49137) TaxID=857340 RepID=A0A086TCM7_HAPC1|nr:hypothetical protein ACRE_019690 [Hapsidospora chrysogenum ATCC 11550]
MSWFLLPTVADNPTNRPEPSPFASNLTKKKDERPRAAAASWSFGEWWRRLFDPSLKPERGGTLREERFWDEPSGTSTQRTPKSRRGYSSGRSQMEDPDRIIHWSTAMDISEDHEPATDGKPLPPLPSERKRSWSPPDEPSMRPSKKHSGQGDAKVSCPDVKFVGVPENSPTQTSLDTTRRLVETCRAMEAKRELRRQRRNLKESGDYLGVQGFNPHKGQLDSITPSSSDSTSASEETEQKLNALNEQLRDVTNSSNRVRIRSERKAKRRPSKTEQEKLSAGRMEKNATSHQKQDVTWRRNTIQWSSAQEPCLSPIAQSQRSGTPVSARLDPTLSPGGSNLASRSPGTTARTSNRGSWEVAKSAAQELLENGIRFDHADEPNPANLNKLEPGNVLPTHPDGRTQLPSTSTAQIEAGLGVRPSAPAEHGSRRSDGDSFLAIGALGQREAQGQDSTFPARSFALIHTLMLDGHLVPTTGREKGSMEPESRAGSRSSVNAKNSVGQGNPTDLGLQLDGADSPSIDVSPRHKLSPRRLLRHLKKKRHQDRNHREGRNETATRGDLTMDLLRPTRLPDATNVVLKGDKLLPYQATAPRKEISTRDCIKRDLDLLKTEVAKVDDLNRMNGKAEWVPHAVNCEWVEDAIRRIEKKGTEAMALPVSTPTTTATTTTGCGLPNHPLNLNLEVAKRETGDQGQLIKYRPCPEPTWTLANTNMKSPRQKNASSPLVRLTPEGKIAPTEITSTINPDPANDQSAYPATLEDQGDRAMELTGPVHKSSPTSMSAAVGSKGSPVKCRDLFRIRSLKQKDGILPHQDELASRTTQVRYLSGGTLRRASTHPTPNWKQRAIIPRPENFSQFYMQGYPGAYPCHLDVEEDIAARFGGITKTNKGNMNRQSTWEKLVGVWMAAGAVFFVARSHLESFARLYWAFTGPVFNPWSAYWVRHAKKEATLSDGVAMVLAMPGVFVSLVALV